MSEQEKTVENKRKKSKKQKDITVKANKKGRHIMPLFNFLRCLVIPIYFLFKPFRYYGNRKVKDGACVYICNHYGLLDPVFTAATTWEGIHYVCKRSLLDVPVLRGILRAVKVIPVNRDGKDVRGLLDCFKCLKNGEKIAVFPEGTRNKYGVDMLPFKHGAAVMAIKTKTPIIPVVMYKKPRLFRCTHVLIGEPIELTEYYDRKLSEEELAEVDNKLRDFMLDMRAKHTEHLQNKKNKQGKKA